MLSTTLQTLNRKLIGNPKTTTRWSATPVAVVMRAVGPSCPPTCEFLPERLGGLPGAGGCYAGQGPTHWRSKNAVPDDGDAEALRAFIRSLPKHWHLRMHVSGDLFRDGQVDVPYTQALIDACRERPDVTAWGYTHGWRALEAAGFGAQAFRVGGLVLNASCGTVQDAEDAKRAGWNTAITASSDDTRTSWRDGELRVVTCPADTVGLACNTCLLCARDRSGTVAFRHHGSGAGRADRRLEALTQLPMAGD